MKRIVGILTIITVLMCNLTAFAANSSVTGTVAQLLPEQYEGKEVLGYIVDEEGTIIRPIIETEDEWIKVTDYSVAEKELPADQFADFAAAVKELKGKDVADVVAKDDMPAGFDSDNAVAWASFHVDASDNIKAELEANENYWISINVDAGVPANAKVLVLCKNTAGEWVVVEAKNNGDGKSVNLLVGQNGLFGPFTLYIDAQAADGSTPKTGDSTNAMLYVAIAVVALAGTVVVMRKRRAI